MNEMSSCSSNEPHPNHPNSSDQNYIPTNRNNGSQLNHRSFKLMFKTKKKLFTRWIMKSYPIHTLLKKNYNHLPLHASNLEPFNENLAIQVRPFFGALTAITLIFLGVIGFSKSVHSFIPIPSKLFHFFGFAIITGLIYSVPDIDDRFKVIWYWNHFHEILVGFICFFLGGFGSEFIQLFLPWKIFSWGDLLANELGCLAGYQMSRILHRRYRDGIELSNLYEPLEGGREAENESNSDQNEQDNLMHHRQQLTPADSIFGAGTNHAELSSVWSDRLDDHHHELFKFDEDEDDEQI